MAGTDANSALPISGNVSTTIRDGTISGQVAAVDSSGNLQVGQSNPAKLAAIVTQGPAAAANAAWPVKPTDGANSQAYTVGGEAKVSLTTALPAGTNSLGSVLSNLQVSNAPVTTTNPVPVTMTSTIPGTQINNYFVSSAAVAAGSSDTHVYTVTSGKTLNCKKFFASASGKMRIDVQVSPDGTTFNTVFTAINSAANPNISIDLDLLTVSDSGTGAKVQIVRTNEDIVPFSMYSTICGVEN